MTKSWKSQSVPFPTTTKKCFICFGKCEKNEKVAEQAKLRLVSRNFAVELEEEGKRRRQV